MSDHVNEVVQLKSCYLSFFFDCYLSMAHVIYVITLLCCVSFSHITLFYVHVEQVHFDIVVYMIYKYLIHKPDNVISHSFQTKFAQQAFLDYTISLLLSQILIAFFTSHKQERTEELISYAA